MRHEWVLALGLWQLVKKATLVDCGNLEVQLEVTQGSIPITVLHHQESRQCPTVKAFIGYSVYYTSDNI